MARKKMSVGDWRTPVYAKMWLVFKIKLQTLKEKKSLKLQTEQHLFEYAAHHAWLESPVINIRNIETEIK